MALDDQDKAAIAEMIAAGQKTLMESLTPTIAESIERSVKGNKTDLKGLEKQIGDIASQFGQLKTEIPATVKANLDSLLDELGQQVIEEEKGGAGKQQADASVSSGNNADDIQARIDAALAAVKKESQSELKKLQSRLTEAERIATEERQQREAIAEQNRVATMKQSVVKALSGKVISGKEERALRALLEEGKLVEDKEAGAYKLKGKDKYGDDVLLPLDNEAFVATLQSDFSEFIPARSGTGTGATASGGNSQPVAPKYVTEDTSAQSLLNVAADESAFKESVRELEQLLA